MELFKTSTLFTKSDSTHRYSGDIWMANPFILNNRLCAITPLDDLHVQTP